MASSIGQGGNYFSQINHQVAKGPDSKTAENLHHTGGTANTQRKTVVKKGVEQEEGFTFSDAARKSLQASHQEHIEGHEHELAAHAGLQELEPENTEDHELKTKRGHERDQEEKAEKAKAGATMLPDGFVRIRNDQGCWPPTRWTLSSCSTATWTKFADACSATSPKPIWKPPSACSTAR
ncbi:MAG: hypothetical protein J0I12_11040 [Candidatus Eremiobacteraeota bacterium]|nr:hypothetical protein [Candidatus Eremiobacteraeota bacterium]